MARDHSLRSGWFGGIGGSRNPSRSASTVSRPLAAIEALEERRLLPVSGSPIIIPPTPTPVPPVTFAARGYGVTLNLRAGQPFNGYLGDLVGAKVPAGFIVSSSVNWGDGTAASAGTVKIGSTGNIDVGGSHTYTRIGRYAITIAVTATPAPAPTGAAAEPILLYLGSIHSKANVTSSGSVTLHETAGVPFTAVVGTFSYIGVPTGLAANIDWGDGSAPSAGKIAISAIGAAALFNFKVIGSHTYANPGKYPIVVTITQQLGPPGSLAPIRLVTTIDSTAIVAATGLNLDGTITGTLSPAPTAASLGALYLVTGTGSVQAMGPVAATGRIQLPPFMTTGPVSGNLTLTTISARPGGPNGSVTLTLAGPAQAASAPIPPVLTYVIASGTGDFANATGTGTIDVTLSSQGLGFTFVITSN